jgi:hypothetical protein
MDRHQHLSSILAKTALIITIALGNDNNTTDLKNRSDTSRKNNSDINGHDSDKNTTSSTSHAKTDVTMETTSIATSQISTKMPSNIERTVSDSDDVTFFIFVGIDKKPTLTAYSLSCVVPNRACPRNRNATNSSQSVNAAWNSDDVTASTIPTITTTDINDDFRMADEAFTTEEKIRQCFFSPEEISV